MWISKIELFNFKSYLHQVFDFPSPEDGKNIVLIGGMNGYGKTSILEALYLCLYGKDAMVHLARAGLQTDESRGYPTFLENAFNGEAKRDARDTMAIKVIINKSKSKAIDITRKWYFRSNGTWAADEEAVVRDVERNIPGSPRTDGKNNFHLSDILDDFFVPAHIAPFFFFDGEEVMKLADQGRIEQVKLGLEGLLGVVLLRSLSDRLRGFESKKKSEFTSVDENNLNQLHTTLTANEQLLSDIRKKINDAKIEMDRFRANRQTLIERITSAGGGGGDVATVKELVEEREHFRTKLKETQKALEDLLSGIFPFHLVSKDLADNYRLQLLAEIRYFAWETDKRSLEPRKIEFENAFNKETEPEITPPLTNEQSSIIQKRIDSAWASLFYPPPADCAKEIIHTYLHEPQRQAILEFLNSLTVGQQDISRLISEENSLNQSIEELSRKIARIEGIDRDGTLTTLKNDLKLIQEQIDSLSDSISENDRKSHALEAQVGSQRAEYEREKKKLDESSPVREIIEKSERVRKSIDKIIPSLFPLKVKELASAMTSVYKKLAHKDQISKIEISDDGTTQILSKTGKEIHFDRSAGENQIFATALIAGLAIVSGVKAPMVVDTPLGRLDSKHRSNILKFWTSSKNRQVILLSQDKEIDSHYFRQISANVSKTYLLDHIDVGDGIGRTTAQEDSYFQDVAK